MIDIINPGIRYQHMTSLRQIIRLPTMTIKSIGYSGPISFYHLKDRRFVKLKVLNIEVAIGNGMPLITLIANAIEPGEFTNKALLHSVVEFCHNYMDVV